MNASSGPLLRHCLWTAHQEAGASFITLHPRTKRQAYSGAADWSLTARAAALLRVPLVGGGAPALRGRRAGVWARRRGLSADPPRVSDRRPRPPAPLAPRSPSASPPTLMLWPRLGAHSPVLSLSGGQRRRAVPAEGARAAGRHGRGGAHGRARRGAGPAALPPHPPLLCAAGRRPRAAARLRGLLPFLQLLVCRPGRRSGPPGPGLAVERARRGRALPPHLRRAVHPHGPLRCRGLNLHVQPGRRDGRGGRLRARQLLGWRERCGGRRAAAGPQRAVAAARAHSRGGPAMG
jgi:hypothetical protein